MTQQRTRLKDNFEVNKIERDIVLPGGRTGTSGVRRGTLGSGVGKGGKRR